MKVVKFGGTSLADAEQIRKVCKIITADPERRLIVVSAPGKRFKDDIKVTDLLIKCAEKRLEGGSAEEEADAVVARYGEIAEELGLSGGIVEEIAADLCRRLSADRSNRHKFMDFIKAAGEDNCAKLVARYLKKEGVNAVYVNPREAGMLLSGEYGNARVLPEAYEKLKELRHRRELMIFPGFFGYTPEGEVMTFPRGGSDITGSILAAAVDADVYENFTDVDYVFSADPRIVENPKPITVLTYREMRELSYAGFNVLHEDTTEPVYRKGIPINIRNTNRPDAPGTMIVPERNAQNGPVVGIACDKGFCYVFISKYMMNREIGFGRRVLQIFEEEHISYEHTPSGIDNISVIVKEKQFGRDVEERVVRRIKESLQVDDVYVERNRALIMLAGEGMMRTVGIAYRATGAFARAGINIEMINQGSSEVSMMFGVLEEDAENAVRALYREFFGNEW